MRKRASASARRSLPRKVPSRDVRMQVTVLSRGARAPRAFTERSMGAIVRELLTKGTSRRNGTHRASERLSSRAAKRLLVARELSVMFVTAEEIRRLNREFRGKDKPTDILSFDPVEEGSLGELVIALDVIRAQARDHGLTLQDELGYMLLHGILHLLGYDHEVSAAGAKKMFAIQDAAFDHLRGRWR